VVTPLHEAPPDCVGCLACAQICPTNFIKYTDDGATRTIWGRKFEMLKCEKTGRPTITKEFAEHLSRHQDIPADYFNLGDLAHRRETAATMGRIAMWDRQEES